MIDLNPQVGRYLVKDTIFINSFCYRFGKITEISSGGKQFTINCERGADFETVESEKVRKFAAICDTREEAMMLHEHSQKCIREHWELERAQRKEWEAFFRQPAIAKATGEV